jgi:crotonobetainyl-CoA:carnitine CoA-transferase CaiB-like acyl-CoA transferase
VENRDALLPIIAEYMSGKKIDEVVAALRRASIPAGEVKTIEDAFVSEPATFRDVVVSSPHPVLGEVLSVRSPLRFSAASHLPATAPPLLGEHTAEVLEKVLSFTSSDVSSLREKGIIG